MSLNIVGITEFPCRHCGARLSAKPDQAPLSTMACTTCLHPVQVPARLGDITLLGRLGQHPAGDMFEAYEDLSARPLNMLVCHPPEGKLRPIVDATIEVHRRLALAPGQHLVRIYRLGFFEKNPIVITEPHNPSLRNLSRKKTFGKAQIRSLAASVVSGLREARRAGLDHCGLHPAAVLMRPDGLRVFGFSPWNYLDRPPGDHWKNLYPPLWVPPEVLAGAKPNLRSDVWSVGALLLYLATRQNPNSGEAPEKALRRLRPDLSPGFVGNVTTLMAPNPLQRPDSWKSVLAILSPGSRASKSDSGIVPATRDKGRSASQVISRLREDENTSTLLYSLDTSGLSAGASNAYDQIRSLATDPRSMMDMAADELRDSEVVGPVDIMTRKVVDGGEEVEDVGSGALPWLDEPLDEDEGGSGTL